MLTRPALALVFTSVLSLLTTSHSYANSTDGLVNALADPAGWRMLGTVTPGVTNGVRHDLYANSALLAAVLKDQGLQVPFVKLTADPAAGVSALGDYLQRLHEQNIGVSDETCGVAVGHVYGLVFSQLLISQGPQWVTPGIGATEAQAQAQSAAVNFKNMRSLASELCDSSQYRALDQAFDALLTRVTGEMPYLLNTALPQGQRLDSQQNAQQAAASDAAAATALSRQLASDMLGELAGLSPAITEDPFARCAAMNTQSGYDQKNHCQYQVLTAAKEQFQKLVHSHAAGMSKRRADALHLEQEQISNADYTTCLKMHAAQAKADNTQGFSYDDSERVSRCGYVQIKFREAAMIKSPPRSDQQLAEDELARAQEIAERYPSPTVRPAQEHERYLALLRHSAALGNTAAKVQLATALAQNLNDMSALVEAEQLLSEAETAQGATEHTRTLRTAIAPTLQAWRLKNSPAQQRKDWQAESQGSSDDAVKVAFGIDKMTREGGSCDPLVIYGYSLAHNSGIAINTRLQVLLDKVSDSLARMGCFY